MGSLQDELQAAKVVRDWRAFKGFLTGFFVGAFITWELGTALLIGLAGALIVAWFASGDVNRLKEIQDLRRR